MEIKKDSYSFRDGIVLLFLLLAAYMSFQYATIKSMPIEWVLVISQTIFLALPVLILGKAGNVDLKVALRLNRIDGETVITIMLIALSAIPIVALANLTAMFICSKFGLYITSSLPGAESLTGLLILVPVIALMPAICEEVLFRGMILNIYEKRVGKGKAIIFSAVLFGLYHMNPYNLIGPILLGILFAYLVQLTNSLFAASIAHFTNNAVGVILPFLSNNMTNGNMVGEQSPMTKNSLAEILSNDGVMVITLGILAVVASVFTVILLLLLGRLKSKYKGKEMENIIESEYESKIEERAKDKDIISIAPVIIMSVVYVCIIIILL